VRRTYRPLSAGTAFFAGRALAPVILAAALLACAALAASTAAHAADPHDFRVLHAQAIGVDARELAPATAGGATSLSFQAYGRQFDFTLQSNARLLARVPAPLKTSLQRYPIYKGTIAGKPGSWVRLTRIGAELHGAFWDGTDLYAVAPAREIAPYALQSLDASGAQAVVYRLADTESVLNSAFCATQPEAGSEARSDAAAEQGAADAAASYQKLVGELRARFATVAALAVEQIEIAFIADFEFRNRFPSDPEAAMLARTNIIDGIFDGQVGVAIVPDFTVFTDANDPFTSSDASTLLDEVGTYRQSTPAIRARGLAHLMTGRALNGNTAGVAFIDELCSNFAGSGLSQNTGSTMTSALIAAHEIGHNFGAPHDAESGSPCASTPGTFLMNPQINGSSTFSQCSLDQMRPSVAAASCITPVSTSDAGLTVPAGTINAFNGTPFDVALDVSSVGTTSVNAVVLTASPAANLAVESATVPQATCSVGANSVVTCNLGTMPSSASRRVTLRLRGTAVGAAPVNVTLDASNDQNAQNDDGTVQISVNGQAPTPPPPGGGGGDDGGGNVGWLLIGLLAALKIAASRRSS